jgi:CheY-like chemotaxis protein
MTAILLVDDDRAQLDIRGEAFRQAGHRVAVAATAEEAVAAFQADPSAVVLMDLHLPTVEDGCSLIRRLHEVSPSARIVLLSGFTGNFRHLPEAALVRQVLQKPVRSERILGILRKMAVLVVLAVLPRAMPAQVQSFEFRLAQTAEIVAHLETIAPEHELTEVSLDGKYVAHAPLTADASVLLGRVEAGRHTIRLSRPVRAIRMEPRSDPCTVEAPILYARPDTIGRFSDVPLLAYCEQLEDDHGPYTQFSVVFSNEDGGTSTRALMARWGRTTDIEHVVRVWPERRMIQAKGHREVPFYRPFEGTHPLLIVVTDNNMVAPATFENLPEVRFAPAPIPVDLTGASREKVMDDHPWTYRVASEELEREGKLRPFGTVDGQKISDPRNYLYLEAHIENRDSRFGIKVRLDGETVWRTSHLGHSGYTIERSGWVRTTVELPPGTKAEQVAEIGFECFAEQKVVAGLCMLHQVSKAFFLDQEYRPGTSFFELPSEPRQIPSGHSITVAAVDGHSR